MCGFADSPAGHTGLKRSPCGKAAVGTFWGELGASVREPLDPSAKARSSPDSSVVKTSLPPGAT